MRVWPFAVSVVLLWSAGCGRGPGEPGWRTVGKEEVRRVNGVLASLGVVSVEEMAAAYRPPKEGAEGPYAYRVDVRAVERRRLELVVEEEGLPDDSVEAVRVLMKVRRTAKGPRVVWIGEQYRCRRGRGGWSDSPCP